MAIGTIAATLGLLARRNARTFRLSALESQLLAEFRGLSPPSAMALLAKDRLARAIGTRSRASALGRSGRVGRDSRCASAPPADLRLRSPGRHLYTIDVRP